MRTFRNTGKRAIEGAGLGLLVSLGTWAFYAIAVVCVSIASASGKDWHLLKETIATLKSDPDLSRLLIGIPCTIIFIIITVRFVVRTPWQYKYLKTLSTIPWKAGKQLPGGPIHFSVRLWAMLTSATLFGNLLLDIEWWLFPTTAFFAHAILGALVLFRSNRYWVLSYGIVIPMLIWLFHFSGQPIFPLVILAIIHWATIPLIHKTVEEKLNSPVNIPDKPIIIWPVALQSPAQNQPTSKHPRRKHEWLIQSLFVGLIAYGLSLGELPPVIILSILVIFYLNKTLAFLWEKPTANSLLGRIRKGPLIVAAYDVVFLPLIFALIGMPIAWLGAQLIPEHWTPPFIGLIATLATIGFRKLFPSSEYWTYLAPGKINQQQPLGKQEYKRI